MGPTTSNYCDFPVHFTLHSPSVPVSRNGRRMQGQVIRIILRLVANQL